MRIEIIRSKWDMPEISLRDFLQRIKTAGFDGCEIFLPDLKEGPEESVDLLEEFDIRLIGMIASDGLTVTEHLRSLEIRFARAATYRPVRINCHTGKDYFSLEENVKIIRRSLELSAEAGIPLSHETHRGRATFSTVSTSRLIQAVPEMRLTADFSHWCCVHESLLQDQPEAVAQAIEHADYIHARVGHIEGPQVSDPMAPEWKNELEIHMEWWERIVHHHRRRETEVLAVCPEFGPPPYMPLLPYTQQPVADLWRVTRDMQQLLRQHLDSPNLAGGPS
ncbi:MAG: TIM barrel protein [Bacteroidota bacterium]